MLLIIIYSLDEIIHNFYEECDTRHTHNNPTIQSIRHTITYCRITVCDIAGIVMILVFS